ncbi:unnamed protein product [Fraxinus pennsylvanica]|uniref:Uncharacterized protein n=1 Tax=Fraxinus pennsylvanica TaxID=56036 RepID=A0AAD1Z6B3_9LAMI|nr:unnamed protein product [Fraxinus pennsylvanica]
MFSAVLLALSFGLRKEDMAFENQLIPNPTTKKYIGLKVIRMSKCQPKQNIGLQGSEKVVKQDSGHSQKSIAKIGQSSSSLPKPRKEINRAIPTSTAAAKRSSLGSGVKTENGGTNLNTSNNILTLINSVDDQQFISICNILTLKLIVAIKGTLASKLPVLRGTRKVLHRLPSPLLQVLQLQAEMQSKRSTSSNSTASS